MRSADPAPAAVIVRRRARAVAGTVASLAVLPLVLSRLTGGSPWATAPGLVAGLAAWVLLPDLCQERPPARRSATVMTARTLTGPRSIDLDRITSVRLWTTFTYGGVQQRTLLVRDVHGVRLGVTTAAGRRALRVALERQTRDKSPRHRPRVSPAARACLGGGPRHHLAVHTVMAFLAQVVGLCAYLTVVLKAGGLG
ncbi:hypothetical protein [Streptomyces sp. NPDC093591]|uniref:hypothetical protein n=1 Tax=Streptomyces sp. NPDC093591 TaxID=3366044 RepID=UPI00382C2D03